MLQAVEGGAYRCALVVKLEAGIDDGLLAGIAEATGLAFEEYGYGGFGGETTATVYASGGNLLMEVLCDEIGVKAMFVWADSAENAIAIRSAIGEAMPAWSEQMLRAQIEDSLEQQPDELVALLMACGGANPDQETLDLLRRALDHDDDKVRSVAEYARLVASELVHPPVVMREKHEHVPVDIMRPAQAVDGVENWVTVRAGIPERAVPRPVTWLRTSLESPEKLELWAWDADWDIREIHNREDPDWYEMIYTPMDVRTALHVVRHPALGTVHAALHGEDVEATAADLVAKLGAEILAGPPEGWERTAR